MSHFFKFLLLLVVGISLVIAAERPPCKGVPDGKYVKDPTGCDKYFFCKDEKETAGSCRDGFYFDLRTGGCNYVAAVDCIDAQYVDRLCNGVADGKFLKDPENCQNYYLCEQGKAVKGSCGSGLQFDPEHQTCDIEDQTKCNIKDPSTLTDDEIACRYIPNGVLVQDESDCTGYYACVSGKGKHIGCGTGLLYNKKLGICDYPENVKCDDVAKPKDADICGTGTSDPHAFVKNPKKCSGYYLCVKDKIHSSGVCPKGSIFDGSKCSKTASCTLDTTKLCQGEKNAKMFAHSEAGCKKYYYCKDEIAEEKECPQDFLFNEEISQCVYPDSYNCPI